MIEYMVKRINTTQIKTVDEYWQAVHNASVHYCRGLKELQEYCGGKLHRNRAGYSGTNGSIEYVATRV